MNRCWNFIALCVLSLCAAIAADQPQTTQPASATTARLAVAFDVSRSNADPIAVDRLRLFAGTLARLASAEVTVQAFDKEIRTCPAPEKERFRSRFSDYHRALGEILPPLLSANRQTTVVLAGNGEVEAVYEGMPAGYAALAPAGADREVINAAVTADIGKTYGSAINDRRLGFVILDTGSNSLRGAFATVRSLRPDTLVVPLRSATLDGLMRLFAGLKAPVPGIYQRRDGAGTFELPIHEGAATVDVAVHAVSDPGYEVAFSLNDGTPLPTGALEVLDGDGVARAWRISGLGAGATLRVAISGQSQGYEVLVNDHAHIEHRLSVSPVDGDLGLYAGSTVAVTHVLERTGADGKPVAVSEASMKRILGAGRLTFAAKDVPMTDNRLALPATAGDGILSFTPGSADAAVVSTAPCPVVWTARPTYRISGGFAVPTVHDGTAANLTLKVESGPRKLSSLAIPISGANGQSKTIQMSGDGTFSSELVFAAEERTRWSLPTTVPAPAPDATISIVTNDTGAAPFPTLDVTRNWLPIILALAALLLLILGLLLWLWLTRPRFRGEVVASQDEIVLLSAHRGPGKGPTSIISPRWNKGVILRATRKGVMVEQLAPGASLLINLKPVNAGAILVPGNDLELIGSDGRCIHGRFLATRDQGNSLPPQIDLQAIDGDLVVLES